MIFVTGATGILGTRLVYDLLKAGHRVKALRRAGSDMKEFEDVISFYHDGAPTSDLLSALEWVEGDVMDITCIEEELLSCEQCIHAAAMVSFHPRDKQRMMRVNKEGTANVVNACLSRNVRLLHVSSVAALGRTSGKQEIDETSSWKDSPYNSGYAVSKYRSELEVWRGIVEGLDAVIINPTIILGSGSTRKSSGTLFGNVIQGLPFYTDGGASVVDVRDVSRMALRLLFSEVRAERFVLNGASLPYRSVFDKMAHALGKKRPSIHIGPRMMGIAWRIMALKDFLLRTKSSLTKETARSSVSAYQYDSAKVKERLQEEFTNWEEAIAYHAGYYR